MWLNCDSVWSRFLLEAGLAKGGLVACTQPRRVAAITVARRVSEEMGTRLGAAVKLPPPSPPAPASAPARAPHAFVPHTHALSLTVFKQRRAEPAVEPSRDVQSRVPHSIFVRSCGVRKQEQGFWLSYKVYDARP